MKPSYQKFLIAILIVSCVLSFWLLIQYDHDDDVKQPRSLDNKFDYKLNGFTLSVFNAEGMLDFIITGKDWTHFREEQRSKITHPKILTHKKNELDWQVSSQLGWINDDKSKVVLNNNVVAKNFTVDSSSNMLIMTEDLTLLPLKREFYSESPVRMTKSESEVYGSRINGNLIKEEVEIFNVQALVYPKDI